MNIEKQERINTNIKTRSKNEKVSIKIQYGETSVMILIWKCGLPMDWCAAEPAKDAG